MLGNNTVTQDNQRRMGLPRHQRSLEETCQRSISVRAAVHLGLKGELKELLAAAADILAVDLLAAEADIMVQAAPRGFKGELKELTTSEADIVVKIHLGSQAAEDLQAEVGLRAGLLAEADTWAEDLLAEPAQPRERPDYSTKRQRVKIGPYIMVSQEAKRGAWMS